MQRRRVPPSGRGCHLRLVLAAVLAVLVSLGIAQDLDGYASTRDQPAMVASDRASSWAEADEGFGSADIEPELARQRVALRRVRILRERVARSVLRLTRRWHAVFLAHPPV